MFCVLPNVGSTTFMKLFIFLCLIFDSLIVEAMISVEGLDTGSCRAESRRDSADQGPPVWIGTAVGRRREIAALDTAIERGEHQRIVAGAPVELQAGRVIGVVH